MNNTPTKHGWLVASKIDLADMSDEALLERCKKCGLNARVWSRRFAATLPEVLRRRLHRRKGFLSIHEFAAKVGGMSGYAVDRVLDIAVRLEDKPALKKLFLSGEVGWSKIEKVVYVATSDTEEGWAEKVKKLSAGALGVYVQNYRRKPPDIGEQEAISVICQPPPVRFSCPVDENVEFGLRVAKQDLEKETRQSLTWNETFALLLSAENCVKCSGQKGTLKICKNCAKKIKNE